MDYVMGPGFGFRFGIFQIMFLIVFVLAFGTTIMTYIKRIGEWRKNNQSPRLMVPAMVVAKRTNVSHRRSGGTNGHYRTSTTYFVTFQVESGDRMELQMTGNEYGLLVEGDQGNLTFQGTRYLEFERA